MCLDSFHILSRGHDPADIEGIPGERIFFLQLADAPALTMDVLSWSRHHRLFPGEGTFDLASFVGHVVNAGYRGPLSLEVFNDTFRQTEVLRTARQAKRSLTWLEDQVARLPVQPQRPDVPSRLPDVGQPVGFDFVEVKAEDAGEVDVLLRQLGFTFRGHHRSKPVRLWTQGPARVVCNEELAREWVPTLAAVGFEVTDPEASAERARRLEAPAVFRRTHVNEQELAAFRAPDGTEVFLADRPGTTPAGFRSSRAGEGAGEHLHLTGIDHVNLAHPWQNFDEAVLFYSSVLALVGRQQSGRRRPDGSGPQPGRPQRRRGGPGRTQRRAAGVRPSAGVPQHVAFSSTDVVAAARAARDRGLRPLPIPANYYDDLIARFDLGRRLVEEMQGLGVLYDRRRCRRLHCTSTPRTVGERLPRGRAASRRLRGLRRRERVGPAGRAARARSTDHGRLRRRTTRWL